jgi:hypothetical protein
MNRPLPYVGQIVLVQFPHAAVRPAIVTNVFDGALVNLHVFLDAANDGRHHNWLYGQGATVKDNSACLHSRAEGTEPGQWQHIGAEGQEYIAANAALDGVQQLAVETAAAEQPAVEPAQAEEPAATEDAALVVEPAPVEVPAAPTASAPPRKSRAR